MTTLLTLYARKEPSRDPLSRQHNLDTQDVIFYKDAACTQFYARWTWDRSPPRRNSKKVILNCWTWALKWLTDSPANGNPAPVSGAC